MSRRQTLSSLIFLIGLLLACRITLPDTGTTIDLGPSAVTRPAAIPDDTGWVVVQPGLESRSLAIANTDTVAERLRMVRIDPTRYRLDIGYTPNDPKTLSQWQTETGAVVVTNGGFFTPERTATGLISVDGVVSGQSYVGFGGMLSMRDGTPEIRWLFDRPYDPAADAGVEDLIQSFPMLVLPGGEAESFEGFTNNLSDRRTVIGRDSSGRIILIVATQGAYTLTEMSTVLIESDLELEVALNLDGGSSSGLQWVDPAQPGNLQGPPSFIALPIVILVSPR